ncbi:Auxin response factor 4 isoform 1 [Hibiscus syriacus]|uniref:Auxin response factor 4 isoform 1 n=1 Tax=Hibiscus syriacus TaxID=106335 RepID=A0A6A3CQ07_HIBSY|nr:Auxin response factor 4 isoform 1 [Hibiscus syriacus]
MFLILWGRWSLPCAENRDDRWWREAYELRGPRPFYVALGCYLPAARCTRMECVSMGIISAIDMIMAHPVKDQNSVIRGAPLVRPNDNLFWFNRPTFVLTLLHYTLFMNAFEVAFFVWVTTQYGLESCYHEHREIIVTRVVLAVTVQVICSYVTLPALCSCDPSKMGSNFKRAVLEVQTANAIKEWHAGVKLKRKKQRQSSPAAADDSTNNNTAVSAVDSSAHQHQTPALLENASFAEIQDESGPAVPTSITVDIHMGRGIKLSVGRRG